MQPCAEEVAAISRRLQPGPEADAVDDERPLLRAVCAWLIVNTMKSERLQFNLLCEQSVQNVWRKRAYWTLLRQFADGQTRVELQVCCYFLRDLFFLAWSNALLIFFEGGVSKNGGRDCGRQAIATRCLR